MKISTVLDGEQITIINVTGDVKNQAITYIDSNNILRVKVLPIDWSRKLIFGTGSEVNAPGSPENPFPSYETLVAALPPAKNRGTAYMNRLAGSGVIEMFSDGVAWAPKSCLPIVDLLDVHASVAPGNTTPNDITLFTVPGGMWRSLDSWRFQLTYETAANTGNDGFAIRVNGTDLIATAASANALTAVIAGYRRITTTLRRNYTIVGNGVSTTNPGATNTDFASDVAFVSRLTPANGANSITLRRFSMWRE